MESEVYESVVILIIESNFRIHYIDGVGNKMNMLCQHKVYICNSDFRYFEIEDCTIDRQ